MRTTRLFFAGLVCAVTFTGAAFAQESRYFDDGWFWGVKSGVATFSPTLGSNETAATYGGEWLITRHQGGLYVSFDEANVSTVSAVLDASTSDGFRPVSVDKLRRIGMAALVFPKRFGRFRPYAGIGLSMDLVGTAVPMVSGSGDDMNEAVFDRIEERRSQVGVLGMAGGQVQFDRLAVFGQVSAVQGQSNFLLGDNVLGFFEAGVRYNFGSSREGSR
ncbi:MAG: hypothetical protein ABIU86_10670 [Gemmatimonadaceae bacterium]